MSLFERKALLLSALEKTFDDTIGGRSVPLACGAHCAVCCTRDVLITTLEARRVLTALRRAERPDLLEKIREAAGGVLFRPKLTTNVLAMACLTHNDPPMEEPPVETGVCPLLEDELCPIYDARPFACRGMFSRVRCRPGTEADLPEDLASLTMVCWQIIEHLDAGGLYGNLPDLVTLLEDEKKYFAYDSGQPLKVSGIPPTRPVPGLLVPPDHQAFVQEFLGRLFSMPCGDQTFREAMAAVRPSPF